MDLKFPRETPSKGGGFSSKKIAFLAAAGLVVVAGIALRAGHYVGGPAVEEKAPAEVEAPKSTPAVPPAVETAIPETPAGTQDAERPPATQEAETVPGELAEPASDTAEQAAPGGGAVEAEPEDDALEQAGLPEGVDPSMILVSKQPVEVLASPSSTAPSMFGFPAGRPFRVIGREAGFVRIKDLRSGASGWIEEAALAPAKRAPPAAAPSPSKPSASGGRAATSAGSKPKPAKKDTQVTSDSADEVDSVQTRKRPGLFGKGGLFGGIFGGGN